MNLKVLASGSSGNCYVLDDGKDVLIIDCGVPVMEVKRAIKFQITRIAGVIVSHEHGDHAGYIGQYQQMGLRVFAPYMVVEKGDFQKVQYRSYAVQTFPLVHDVPCFGFIVRHDEYGKILYATDTAYIKYRFKDLRAMIVEANYSKDLLNEEADSPKRSHVLHGHMEIDTTCRFIKANDNFLLEHVILAHRSNDNGNRDLFISKAQNSTQANVHSADKGLEIKL